MGEESNGGYSLISGNSLLGARASRRQRANRLTLRLVVSLCLLNCVAWFPRSSSIVLAQSSSRDLQIAARFAPVFYQAMGDSPRSDYITNFDFDGDWRGDNNWEHAEEKRFPLKAYVYYAVSETTSHLFIHYAIFHPRDYKGGQTKGRILSELIREGVKQSQTSDTTGLMAEAGVAHENDLEGVLVVVVKSGNVLDNAHVAQLETVHHNDFSRFLPEEMASEGFGTFKVTGQRVVLYVEPKGHGIEAYLGTEKQTEKKEFLIYKFTGTAGDPEKTKGREVGYALVPIRSTLWLKAQSGKGKSQSATYGTFYDYATIPISLIQPNGLWEVKEIKVGKIGTAFLGDTGGLNMAKAPWAWFDKSRRNEPLGMWFFDPATIIKRDFSLSDSFSTDYVRPPFWAER